MTIAVPAFGLGGGAKPAPKTANAITVNFFFILRCPSLLCRLNRPIATKLRAHRYIVEAKKQHIAEIANDLRRQIDPRLAIVANGAGAWQFDDSATTTLTKRFYRLATPPLTIQRCN